MRALDKKAFIERARAVHGNHYVYDKSIYVNNRVNLCITCKLHGEFWQRPDNHLSGRGCSECGEISRVMQKTINNDEFISRASILHNDTYDYTETVYESCFKPVKIICKKHGEFYQAPSKHLFGNGCNICGIEKSSSVKLIDKEIFIKRATSIHGERYIYDNVEYELSREKVEIICKEHGSFMMKPNNHLSGQGCPSCSKSGFDKNKDGYVYFLHGNGFVKVGITNKITQRLKQLKSATNFDFNLIAKIKTTGTEAMRIEKYYHKKYESAGLAGFDGATEWLKYSPELMSEIMNERG